MSRIRRSVLVTVCAAVALAACGQRGGLYLPDTGKAPVSQPAPSANQTTPSADQPQPAAEPAMPAKPGATPEQTPPPGQTAPTEQTPPTEDKDHKPGQKKPPDQDSEAPTPAPGN
jgi:predicted small lipoprotein YifL